MTDEENQIQTIVLTGGPGGGKSTFIRELKQNPEWAGRFVALPETVAIAGATGITPNEKRFQRMAVCFQTALEDQIKKVIRPGKTDFLICERGSLDPLAYWQFNGWSEAEFFDYTETDFKTHFARYAAVIHLVTAADGASEFYKTWPDAHRRETPEQAVRLDRLIERVWGLHPDYFKIDNHEKNWKEKSAMVARLLLQIRDR